MEEPAGQAAPRRGQRARAPDDGQRRAEEQAGGARVGAVVDAGDIGEGLVQDGHQHRRPGDPRHDGREQQRPPAQRHQPHEQQRPDDVELLLDRQRPEVQQRRGTPHLLEVGGVAQDEGPVAHVGHGRHGVAADRGDLRRQEDREVRQHGRDEQEERGQQPSRPPQPEAAQRHGGGRGVLREQQRRDQVAADDEEDLHAQEARGHEVDAGVVQHDRDDGERPQAVQAREVGQPPGRERAPPAGVVAAAGAGGGVRPRGAIDAPAAGRDRRGAGTGARRVRRAHDETPARLPELLSDSQVMPSRSKASQAGVRGRGMHRLC